MTYRIEDWAGNFIHGPFENPGDAEDWLGRHIERQMRREGVPITDKTWSDWRAERKAAGLPTSGTRMPREYHRAYEREYFRDEANRARRNALMRGYAKAHGTRAHHAARRKVRSAIVAGKLKRQPCEVCGASRVHAHHDDYSKPLAVRWLCHPHHVAHHAKAEGR